MAKVIISTDPYLSINVGEGAPPDPNGVTITTQPVNTTVAEPDPAIFFVAATSGDLSPLSYQWQVLNGNWLNLSDGGDISGATTDTLTISPTDAPDNQEKYRCIVTNAVNSQISRTATLDLLLGVVFINGPVQPFDAVAGVPVIRDASQFFTSELPPVTYAESGTAWPAWINLNTNTGQVTGTPPGVANTSAHSVTATDSNSNTATTNTFDINVIAAPAAISFSGTIPDIVAVIGTPIAPFNAGALFSGTEGPFTFTKLGSWPSWLQLDSGTGIISGTPDAEATVTGLQVRGTDQTPDTADSNTFTSDVSAAVATYFSVDLQALLTAEIAQGSAVPANARASISTLADYKGTVRTVAVNIPKFLGARLDPDNVTYHTTRDDGVTPIDQTDFFADANGPYGYASESESENLKTYSEQFDDVSWIPTRLLVTPNAIAGPDLEVTADKVIAESSAPASHYFSGDFTVSNGERIAMNVYAKAAEYEWLQITESATGFPGTNYVNFNLITGAIGNSSTPSADDIGIVRLGNGWFKCFMITTAEVDGIGRCLWGPISDDLVGRIPAYAGDSVSGIYAWGYGGQNGDFFSTYIKTEATTETRLPDNLSYETAGNHPANDVSVQFDLTGFIELASERVYYESYVDANNYTRIYTKPTGELTFLKRIGGVDNVAETAAPYNPGEFVPAKIEARQSSTAGMELLIDDVSQDTNADTQDLQLGANFTVGGERSAGTSRAGAAIRFFRIEPV